MSAQEKACVGKDRFPAVVRKLDRKSSWGHQDDAIDDRVVNAVGAIFPSDRVSFYRLSSLMDLERVVVGFNMKRDRRKSRIAFVGFTEDELLACKLDIISGIAGDTDCLWANGLHIDVVGSIDKFSILCRNAFVANRDAFQVSQGDSKNLADRLESEGCKAFANNSECSHCLEPVTDY